MAKIQQIVGISKKKPENFLSCAHANLNYVIREWLIALAEGEDDDLTSGAKAERDETAEACGDEDGLVAFVVPVVELPA